MSLRVVVTAVVAAAAVTGAALVWRTQPTEPPDPIAGSANVLDGAALFRAKGCATCHDGPDTASSSDFPDLSNAPEWAGERRPGMSAADYVAESIRQPGAFISPAFEPFGGPTTAMPDLDVSDEEVEALVAYLLAD